MYLLAFSTLALDLIPLASTRYNTKSMPNYSYIYIYLNGRVWSNLNGLKQWNQPNSSKVWLGQITDHNGDFIQMSLLFLSYHLRFCPYLKKLCKYSPYWKITFLKNEDSGLIFTYILFNLTNKTLNCSNLADSFK